MTFVARVCTSGTASVDELNEFLAKTRGSRFLLSKEIAAYMNEIQNKAGHLSSTISVMQSLALTDEWRKKHADKWLELTEWFQQQLNVIPDKFAPFLSVEDI